MSDAPVYLYLGVHDPERALALARRHHGASVAVGVRVALAEADGDGLVDDTEPLGPRTTLRLSEAEIARARALGEGETSRGVRRAIRRAVAKIDGAEKKDR